MDKKIQKDQKKPQLSPLKSQEKTLDVWSKSRVLRMPPALNSTEGWAKTPKPLLWPDAWTHLFPHPIRNQLAPASGSEQGNLLLVFAPSWGRRGPNKGLPEFLVWPLVNFCCLGKAKNPGQYQSRPAV